MRLRHPTPLVLLLALILASACSDGTTDTGPGEPETERETPAPDADAGVDADATEPEGRERDGAEAEPEVAEEPSGPPRCNGFAELCGRKYSDVAYACTHNAMSSAERDWIGPNQTYAMPRQLADGVRAMMLDTHEYLGEAYLCHSECETLGHQRLAEGLAEIRAFLDDHPREVVTIIFEAYISAAQTEAAFRESGLLDLVYAPPAGEPWTTLEAMIAADTRVVVLTDRDGGAYPWYLHVWDYTWDTDWSNRVPEDFSCDRNRGPADAELFILNHFLTRPFALPSLAEEVNHDPFFGERAAQCRQEGGQIPNFVTVDFYDIGDVFAVVNLLNGVTTP